MANVIKIKRNTYGTSSAPSSLAEGELAYSQGDNKLYIGTNSGADVTQVNVDTNTTYTSSDFNHDDLSGLSGTAGQYNHPTDAQMTVLGNTSGTNTGDEPNASTTVKGIIEIATTTETTTGTDTTRAVTAAGVKAAIDARGYSTTTGTVTSVGGTGSVNGITLSGSVTSSGNLTLGGALSGITLSQIAASAIQTGAEAFVDSDSVVMTAAAVQDKIESYGFSTSDGDITAVTAGNGLTGGGTSGSVTLNIGAGTGLTVAADSIGLSTATQTSLSNGDTAYGWGDWASGVDKTFVDSLNIDADKLDGKDSTYFYPASNPNGYTANTGTVTSVNMSVPTGLSISGNPITTSGTLALSFSTGYSIPTTSKQSNWDEAYTWYTTMTDSSNDANSVIDRWYELVDALNSAPETVDILNNGSTIDGGSF